jgi:D-tyrosyl-tRNA(Tyr) deacylase
MKTVVQRVNNAEVCVDGEIVGSIKDGLLIFVGICKDDDEASVKLMAQKICSLRIFCDENGKLNRSVMDVNGEILSISNFTLCANTKKGTRPSFDPAMSPKQANVLYELFCDTLAEIGVKRSIKGIFGADMKVTLCNDGPVTMILDTDIWRKK